MSGGSAQCMKQLSSDPSQQGFGVKGSRRYDLELGGLPAKESQKIEPPRKHLDLGSPPEATNDIPTHDETNHA